MHPHEYEALKSTDTGDAEVWINAGEVRRLCGDISQMSLHRWLADDKLGFPRPAYVNGKRYWIKGDVLTWRAGQFEAASAMKANRPPGLAGPRQAAVSNTGQGNGTPLAYRHRRTGQYNSLALRLTQRPDATGLLPIGVFVARVLARLEWEGRHVA